MKIKENNNNSSKIIVVIYLTLKPVTFVFG